MITHVLAIVQARPFWSRSGVQAIGSLVILLALGLGYNASLAPALSGDMSTRLLFGLWLIPMGFNLALIVGVTWGIGKMADKSVTLLDVLAAYGVSSLCHILSGTWMIYQLVQGVPPRETQLLDLNVFEWGGNVGVILSRLSLDELLHLVLYGLLIGRLYQLRSWWWISAILLCSWMGLALISRQLLPF